MGKMEAFVQEHGHARVPMTMPLSPLAKRVTMYRYLKAEDHLSPEHIGRLDGLPGWEWNAFEAAWMEGYCHLQNYRAQKGHARPKPTDKFHDFPLGQWVVVQRSNRNKKAMSDERIQLLEAIDGWVWSVRDDRWMEGYRHLLDFHAREGHTRVRQGYKAEDGYPLGTWTHTQRQRKGTLSPERIQLLKAIDNWEWEPREKTVWTPEEDEILGQDGFSLMELCQLLPGRTRGSIATRRTTLKAQRGDKLMRNWTPEEDKIVGQDGVPLKDLLNQLPGRTLRAATTRRSFLKQRDAAQKGISA